MSIESIFLDSAIKRFKEHKDLGDKTLTQLTVEQLHYRPDEESNSIAIIIQHMNGNMLSRWSNFLTEDGEKEWRKRDEEFIGTRQAKDELIELWEGGWNVFLETLHSLTIHDLAKTITIRTKPLIVVDAINRQLAHYSYHVGQIVYLGKWMKKGDWQSLSIPKGSSQGFNQEMRK